MFEWFTKYWLEVLFGLICSGIALSVRHHIKLYIEEKRHREQDMLNKIDNKFDQQRTGMQEQMAECYNNLINVVKESDAKSREEDEKIHHEIDIIKDGMLSVEGRAFRNECRKLLEDDHVITLNEYEAILAEHVTYNNLGGNHEGDGLFSMVQAKYQNQLQNKGKEE